MSSNQPEYKVYNLLISEQQRLIVMAALRQFRPDKCSSEIRAAMDAAPLAIMETKEFRDEAHQLCGMLLVSEPGHDITNSCVI